MAMTWEIMRHLFNDVRAAPFAMAPERAEELMACLLKVGKVEIEFVDGYGRFVAMPGVEPHIKVSSAGLASLWALSFVAFRFMDLASKIAASPEGCAADFLLIEADPVYRELIKFAWRLIAADEPWLDEWPRPEPGTEFESAEGRVNNLFLAATSWILLHELGHLTLGHSRFVSEPLRLHQEEEADRFAVQWALKNCPTPAEREFRVLAIIVSLAWLFLFEFTSRGGGDHPSAIARFWQATSFFDVPDDSPGLECGVYLLKAVFDPDSTDMPAVLSAGKAFEWIADRLAERFPRE